MVTKDVLESYLGKNIKDICENHFDDPSLNHCAHFVSHVLGLDFSFNCKDMTGGKFAPANIRVHEIFPRCPKVGNWQDANDGDIQLVFVTRKDVVNLPAKKMQNIPQKHVGIYCDGHVYNYSNGGDKFVKVKVDKFYDQFQAIYAGDQGLFFGTIPGTDLLLSVDATGSSVDKGIAFSLSKQGKKWIGERVDTPAETPFYIGTETIDSQRGYYGLFQPTSSCYGPKFAAEDHFNQIDQWAYLLDVTGYCESGLYINRINTYDRARFTFGFYQLAAHTPNDNLILFFKSALLNEEFQSLFPDLRLDGGRVFRVAEDGGATDLERKSHNPDTDEDELLSFMEYLNPKRKTIDEQEVLQAARLVWWANKAPACASIQASVSADILQRKMSQRYNSWYDLDGEIDTVCAIISDIHHQGRAKKAAVRHALSSSNKIKALLGLGKDDYRQRVESLEERITFWMDKGALGKKRYKAASNQFE